MVRGVTSRAEILRRPHHSYVTLRDLNSPDGELAVEMYQGCQAIEHSRAIRDGDFVNTADLRLKLQDLRWRALVIGAGRGEHARSELLARLGQSDVLASPLLELDTAFRQRDSDPSLGSRIAGAAHGVKAVLHHWSPNPAESFTEPTALTSAGPSRRRPSTAREPEPPTDRSTRAPTGYSAAQPMLAATSLRSCGSLSWRTPGQRVSPKSLCP